MKILERPVETWTKKVNCYRCRAVLEADAGDLCKKTVTMGDQRDSYDGTQYYVSCPICSYCIVIDEKELGYTLQQKAKYTGGGRDMYDR